MVIKKLFLLPVCFSFFSVTLATSSEYVQYKADEKSNECIITFAADKDGESTAHFGSDAKCKTISSTIRKGLTWGRVKSYIDPCAKEETKPVYDASHTFKCWTVDGVGLSDSYEFSSSSITVYGKWKTTITGKSFASATWSDLSSIAEDGLEALKTQYNPTGGTFIIQNPNDVDEVAAKTRYVKIDGIECPSTKGAAEHNGEWPVHVIGESHDELSVAPGKVAALTFEFNEIIMPNIGYDYTSSQGHQTYSNSSIRTTLNNYLLPLFDYSLRSNIKAVNRKADDGLGNNNIVTNTESLFALSRHEISKVEDDRLENSYYPYYQIQNSKSNDFIHSRIKNYNGNPAKYWLRSPSLEVDENYSKAYYVDSDGSIKLSNTDVAMGIAPAFCIGEDSTYKITCNSNAMKFIFPETFATKTMPVYGKIYLDETLYDYPDKEKLVITINGITLTEDKYVYKHDGLLGEFEIKQENITNDVTISCNIEKSLFKSDSWEDMIKIAMQDDGIQALQNRYNEGQPLTGFKRAVRVKNESGGEDVYWLRVIDTNKETFVNGKDSALVFEFITPVKLTSFSDTGDTYIGGKIDTFLNDSKTGFATKMPFNVGQTIKKTYTYDEETSSYVTQEHTAQMWIPSLDEIGLSDDNYTPGEGNQRKDKVEEDYKYTLYEDVKFLPADRYKKYNGYKSHDLCNYYLRSIPNLKTNPVTEAYSIDSSKDAEPFHKLSTMTEQNYIYPIFAIGKSADPYTISFSGTNVTMNGQHSFEMSGYDNTNYTLTIKADTNYRVPANLNDVVITYNIIDEATGKSKWVPLEGATYTYVSDDEGTIEFKMPEGRVMITAAGHEITENWWDNIDKELAAGTLQISDKKPFQMVTMTSHETRNVKARLIGRNQDYLAVGEGEEPGSRGKAATTWEMVNNYVWWEYGEDDQPYFPNDNDDWEDSPVREMYDLGYRSLEIDMKRSIKQVAKKVYTYNTSSDGNLTRELKYVNDYFSVHSLSNILSTKAIQDTSSDWLTDGDKAVLIDEGEQYDWYRDKIMETFDGTGGFDDTYTLNKLSDLGIPPGRPSDSDFEYSPDTDWGGCWWHLRSRFESSDYSVMYFCYGPDWYDRTYSWGDTTGYIFSI